MQFHRLNHVARALASSALVMLALAAAAAPAGARTDVPPETSTHHAVAPVVRQTIVRSGDDGLGTLGLVLIGVGAGAAILGAGYLGARIATRPNKLRVS